MNPKRWLYALGLLLTHLPQGSAATLTAEQSIISDVSVSLSPIDNNPDVTLVKVEGRILLGVDACAASGKTAILQNFRYQSQWYFRPLVLQRKKPDENCNQKFNPQYMSINLAFKAPKALLRRMVLVNLDAQGELKTFCQLAAQPSHGAEGRLIRLVSDEQDQYGLLDHSGKAVLLSFNAEVPFALEELVDHQVRIFGTKRQTMTTTGQGREQIDVQNIELAEETPVTL